MTPRCTVWMPRLAALVGSVLMAMMLVLPLSACDKPKSADCKKAVDNIIKLYGTEGREYGVKPRAMVRSCRGSASRRSVKCFMNAKSVKELQGCEGGAFEKMFSEEKDKADTSQEKDPAEEPATKPGDEPAAGQ